MKRMAERAYTEGEGVKNEDFLRMLEGQTIARTTEDEQAVHRSKQQWYPWQ